MLGSRRSLAQTHAVIMWSDRTDLCPVQIAMQSEKRSSCSWSPSCMHVQAQRRSSNGQCHRATLIDSGGLVSSKASSQSIANNRASTFGHTLSAGSVWGVGVQCRSPAVTSCQCTSLGGYYDKISLSDVRVLYSLSAQQHGMDPILSSLIRGSITKLTSQANHKTPGPYYTSLPL